MYLDERFLDVGDFGFDLPFESDVGFLLLIRSQDLSLDVGENSFARGRPRGKHAENVTSLGGGHVSADGGVNLELEG